MDKILMDYGEDLRREILGYNNTMPLPEQIVTLLQKGTDAGRSGKVSYLPAKKAADKIIAYRDDNFYNHQGINTPVITNILREDLLPKGDANLPVVVHAIFGVLDADLIGGA